MARLQTSRHSAQVRSCVAVVVCLSMLMLTGRIASAQSPIDDIYSVRVVEIKRSSHVDAHWDLNLEVDYSSNPAHGKVWIGAQLIAPPGTLTSGYNAWGADIANLQGDVVRGMQRTRIVVTLFSAPVRSQAIEAFMYDTGGREFVRKTFPWNHDFFFP